MGLVLGIPFIYFMSTVLKNEDGVIQGFKEAWIRLMIWWQRRGQRGRLDLYDSQQKTDLQQLAIQIPPKEEELEFKRNIRDNETDNILIYGGNTKGETLLARVSRRPDGLSSAWLILKTENGDVYQLPKEALHVQPKTINETFVGGGLRIKCVVPMRRWRVSFNGLLRKTNSSDDKLHHLKFSIIWTASSGPNDLNDSLRSETVAKYLAKQSGLSSNLKSLTTYLDSYSQTGFLFGTVQIADEDPQEIYLWGLRKRSVDISDENSPLSQREYFSYSIDGEFLHYGQLKYPAQKSMFEHGFVVRASSLAGNCRICRFEILNDDTEVITATRGPLNVKHCFQIKDAKHYDLRNGDNANSESILTLTKVCVNDDDMGHGIIIQTNRFEKPSQPELQRPRIHLPIPDFESLDKTNMVLPLTLASCRSVALSGGKGSSLAELTLLSQKSQIKFEVPNGVVVSTTAYSKFIQESELSIVIKSIEDIAWNKTQVNLQEACEMAIKLIEEKILPISIQSAITENLKTIFGNKLETTKFAVRSSAAGEDSEELSAAGQMTTYLGVQGLEKIMVSVVRCWASQFSFVATQYKRQNGQILNSPMAVVIQEMVPADLAGVMFTCDPVTGNPSNITITANYGIGESVVSAAADPDTVVHRRDENGLTGQAEVQIGKKSVQIVMADEGGVVEKGIDINLANQCCLSDENGKRLADLGILVEEVYGCPIDIEWGIKENKIYLLQARPITTFDKETDFEITHELDSPMRSEEEYGSTANVGEVMPGAFSYLGATAMSKAFEVTMQWHFGKRGKYMFPANMYYNRGMVRVQNHAFFALFDSLLRFYHGEQSFITDSQMVSMFGRILEDKEMLDKAAKRNALYPSTASLPQIYHLITDMLFANKTLNRNRNDFFYREVNFPTSGSAAELHTTLWKELLIVLKPTHIHSDCSIVSSLYNTMLLSILVSEYKEWCPEVYRDFAYILSTCLDVESVDVPNAIDNLAVAIADCTDPVMFKNINSEEALKWLQESDNKAGEEFRLFLEHHGHRCYKEFDMISNPWGDDPMSLVKTLQEMAHTVGKAKTIKKPLTTSETIRNLQTTLSFKNKLLMRIAIPLSRKGVGMRERSKSLLIKTFDHMRKGYHKMADFLVSEGRIPEWGLIHFLTYNEIDYLIKTRSPNLVQKAIRRKQLYPEMDKLIFPEIMKGIPKPVNYLTSKPSEDVNLTIKGVPVSTGIAKGPARVATTLEEAAKIQRGEILIAYSTDIGWSPYFPMLAGVATELGGLVSHGAVVAREYGLPCVVGVAGATLQFKTGDMVMLNGNKGILQRVQS